MDRFTSCHIVSGKGLVTTKTQQLSDTILLAQSKIPFPPLSSTEKLQIEFIQEMESNVLAAKLTMMPKMHILIHVPERIGYNQALDDAVRCITSLSSSQNNLPQSQRYVKALRSLQKALESQTAACTPETLAAASLLQMYEIHTDLDGRGWIQHARGTIKLLQLYGSRDVSSSLQRAVLAAEASELFLSALIARRFRFLGRPGWDQHLPYPTTATSKRSLDRFISIVLDGTHFDDTGSFCSYFASSCEFKKALPSKLHNELATGTILDLLRLRQRLYCLISDISMATTSGEVDGAVGSAAFMAIKCFQLMVVSYILWSRAQSAKLNSSKLLPLPENLTEIQLEQERFGLLQSIMAHSNKLAEMDPELRIKAGAALQVMLGSLQATTVPGFKDFGESATLLNMLDAGLEDAGWH